MKNDNRTPYRVPGLLGYFGPNIYPPEELTFAKYRWEFLRRNCEYKQAWSELQTTLKKKCSNAPNKNRFMSSEELKFAKEWDWIPLDPDTQCSDDLPAQMLYHYLSYINETPYPVLIKSPTQLLSRPGELTRIDLSLDLTFSRPKLINAVDRIISELHKWQSNDSKYQFGEIANRKYDNYLKAYDLRVQKKSWGQIAKKLGTTIQTCRNWVNSADRLIEKGPDSPYVKT